MWITRRYSNSAQGRIWPRSVDSKPIYYLKSYDDFKPHSWLQEVRLRDLKKQWTKKWWFEHCDISFQENFHPYTSSQPEKMIHIASSEKSQDTGQWFFCYQDTKCQVWGTESAHHLWLLWHLCHPLLQTPQTTIASQAGDSKHTAGKNENGGHIPRPGTTSDTDLPSDHLLPVPSLAQTAETHKAHWQLESVFSLTKLQHDLDIKESIFHLSFFLNITGQGEFQGEFQWSTKKSRGTVINFQLCTREGLLKA